MNNHILRPGELATIRVNLSAIEKELGRPIPNGFLDVSNYSDHILTHAEIYTICRNINSAMPRRSNDIYVTGGGANPAEALVGTIAIVGFVLAAGAFLKLFFGITLL